MTKCTTWEFTDYPKRPVGELHNKAYNITFTQVRSYNVSNGSRTTYTYTAPEVVNQQLMLVEPNNKTGLRAWVLQPLKASTGGSSKHTKRSSIAAKWVRTTRKVAVKGGSRKTIYRNGNTGEQRVRKMVAKPDGSKRATYVKF